LHGKVNLGLITNVASDSCTVQYALTMRSGMGRESQLDLFPFACPRMYRTEALILLGWCNIGGTPQFPPVLGVYDGL
jgi:hypothetical protein